MKDSVTDISALREVGGFIGACLVDSETGLMLGSEGGGPLDLEVASAGNTEVVKAKLQVMKHLSINDRIEDILITLSTQFHLIRLLDSNPSIFLYLAVHRKSANLGMARIQMKRVEQSLSI